jgi:hypothetical protein
MSSSATPTAMARNTSILHAPDGSNRLAPLYDVTSTVVHHPILTVDGPQPLTDDLGMPIGDARRLGEVTLDEFVREAARWPMSRDRAVDVVRSASARILMAVGTCEQRYPEIAAHVYSTGDRLR